MAASRDLIGTGASNAMAIAWAYGEDGQPEVQAPLSCIRTWLRVANETEIEPAAISKGWKARRANMQQHAQTGVPIMKQVRSSMSYT